MADEQTVGFIGLGVMGAPMAGNLLAARREAGARGAERPAAVAAAPDVVISIVSDDAALREVLGGPEGAIAAARPGSLVIDMSTVSPALARELTAAADDREGAFLDAPGS